MDIRNEECHLSTTIYGIIPEFRTYHSLSRFGLLPNSLWSSLAQVELATAELPARTRVGPPVARVATYLGDEALVWAGPGLGRGLAYGYAGALFGKIGLPVAELGAEPVEQSGQDGRRSGVVLGGPGDQGPGAPVADLRWPPAGRIHS